MKNIIKILVLSTLTYSGLSQSEITLNPSSIRMNNPLWINSSSPNPLILNTTSQFANNIYFLENDNVKAYFGTSQNGFKFSSKNGVLFEVGEYFPYQTSVLNQLGLSVNGNLKSSRLSFSTTNPTEVRSVFVDKDGILKTDNPNDYYQSYNFTAVQAQDWDDQLRKGSGFAWFNTTNAPKTMYLPVNLPDGVKITGVRMSYIDNSASAIGFVLNANNHSNNAFTTICSGSSILADGTIRVSSTAANAIVDNSVNSYYVNISSNGNWTGNTLQFHSLVITYQYQ